MNEWIALAERKPDRPGHYLIACLDNAEGITDVHIGWFDGESFNRERFEIVRHWAAFTPPPLPTKQEIRKLIGGEPVVELRPGDYSDSR